MKDFEEKACLCALNRIFGFEPKVALALISHLGSASEVFRLGSREIDSLIGPYSRYRGLIVPEAMEDAALELERLSKEGISGAQNSIISDRTGGNQEWIRLRDLL